MMSVILDGSKFQDSWSSIGNHDLGFFPAFVCGTGALRALRRFPGYARSVFD